MAILDLFSMNKPSENTEENFDVEAQVFIPDISSVDVIDERPKLYVDWLFEKVANFTYYVKTVVNGVEDYHVVEPERLDDDVIFNVEVTSVVEQCQLDHCVDRAMHNHQCAPCNHSHDHFARADLCRHYCDKAHPPALPQNEFDLTGLRNTSLSYDTNGYYIYYYLNGWQTKRLY